jgi:AcrR family transcriptional regulator
MSPASSDAQLVTSLSNIEEKRLQILAAALSMFADRGYHGTSIPDVIARAKVGASTLYRLYESKEALVNAVFVLAKERLEDALSGDLDREQRPHALFHALWGRLLTFARREPLAFHFLELQDHTAYLDGQSRAVELRVLGPIFSAVSEFQAMGVFTRDVPPEAILAFVWGAFVGLVKAERTGYVKISDETFTAACEAAWRAFARAEPKKESAKESKKDAKKRHKQGE